MRMSLKGRSVSKLGLLSLHPSISTLYQYHLKIRSLPKTDTTTSRGHASFDYNLPIPLTLITSLVTASFNIPRLASISVSQSRARVMPV